MNNISYKKEKVYVDIYLMNGTLNDFAQALIGMYELKILDKKNITELYDMLKRWHEEKNI